MKYCDLEKDTDPSARRSEELRIRETVKLAKALLKNLPPTWGSRDIGKKANEIYAIIEKGTEEY